MVPCNEKPPAGGPGAYALASQPLPLSHSPARTDWPAVGLAASIIAGRYGLSLPWAQLVATAAGLGEVLQ